MHRTEGGPKVTVTLDGDRISVTGGTKKVVVVDRWFWIGQAKGESCPPPLGNHAGIANM